jgi:hypothetical protein
MKVLINYYTQYYMDSLCFFLDLKEFYLTVLGFLILHYFAFIIAGYAQ